MRTNNRQYVESRAGCEHCVTHSSCGDAHCRSCTESDISTLLGPEPVASCFHALLEPPHVFKEVVTLDDGALLNVRACKVRTT